jgi:Fe-S oxidoreductase
MEQKELKQLENICIQDEPPKCQAACPLHVDARALLQNTAKGAWDQAYAVLRRIMPLPGVLGLICEEPCRKNCFRREIDAPLAIGRVERYLVRNLPQTGAPNRLPAKGKSLAVLGSGLSSLCAAWDLLIKGYEVHLHEPGLQTAPELRKLGLKLLPEKYLEKELKNLEDLGLVTHLNQGPAGPEMLKSLLTQHQGVYLGLDAAGWAEWGFEASTKTALITDQLTRSTTRPGVFAGGEHNSFIFRAAQGRWAAVSLDRHAQKVSLTAGRIGQGPNPTRLYTNLKRAQKEHKPAPVQKNEITDQQSARKEAGRCLDCQCLECVKSCLFLKEFKSYPKKYLREIYNNDSIVMGQHQANTLINSCALCELCTKVCPTEFPMAEIIIRARQAMVKKGKMPPSAHEFALLDMDQANSPACSLARHHPSAEASEYIFFPGCQLAASNPLAVQAAYGHLSRIFPSKVGLWLKCCGAPAHWAGRADMFQNKSNDMFRDWQKIGEPTLITACPTCTQTLPKALRQARIISLWEIMLQYEAPQKPLKHINSPLALHDPCTARDMPEMRRSVRKLLDQAGFEINELEMSGVYTQCCGFGGLMQAANPAMAQKTREQRASQSELDFVTYCAMCRDNLAAAGKPTAHILELLFADAGEDEPFSRPWPGWSARQDNRVRLKNLVLKELWHESETQMAEWQKITIHLTPEVRKKLDQRRILDQDIKQVLLNAQKTGQVLKHEESGHFLTGFKPLNVTFWVEYLPEGQGFRIFNAYCHRMSVVKGEG